MQQKQCEQTIQLRVNTASTNRTPRPAGLADTWTQLYLSQYGMALPTVQLQYEVDVQVNAAITAKLPTLPNAFASVFMGLLDCAGQRQKQKHHILRNVRGVLQPGRMTLLLGASGAGKSTLLQALAGRLQSSHHLQVQSDIKYNGHALHEFEPARTVAFVDQSDRTHIANLSVHETLLFAEECQNGDKGTVFCPVPEAVKAYTAMCSVDMHSFGAGGSNIACTMANDIGNPTMQDDRNVDIADEFFGIFEQPNAAAACDNAACLTSQQALLESAMEASMCKVWAPGERTEVVMRHLGLWQCRNTWVGSETMRGISGGQRKRLTAAEMLVGHKQVLLLDDISTGLDSATLHSMMSSMRSLVELQQLSALISLLQPSPDIMALFHDIIVLAEGRVLYHGPVHSVLQHFETLGLVCPPRKDMASFLLEVATARGQWKHASSVHDDAKQIAAREQLLVSLDDMENAFWEHSEQGRAMQALLHQTYSKEASHAQALMRSRYALPWHAATLHVLKRQAMLVMRDKALLRGRLIQAAIIAVIIGSLYVGSTNDIADARKYYGCMFVSLLYISLGQLPVSGVVMALKPMWYKHRAANFYHGFSYVMAASVAQAPVTMLECMVFGTIIYFMANFARTAACYFRYQLIMISAGLCFNVIFNFVANAAPTLEHVNGVGSFCLFIFMVTNGFSIVPSSIPMYWKWVYWINPMAYAFRALAINEFTSSRWQHVTGMHMLGNISMGGLALSSFSLQTQQWWIWVGVAYSIGCVLLFTLASIFVAQWAGVRRPQAALLNGAESKQISAGMQQRGAMELLQRCNDDDAVANLEAGGVGALPLHCGVQRVVLTFVDLKYFVPNPAYKRKRNEETTKELQLLKGITGVIHPGQLTALMGGSGAGKTTFMDIIAMRKTVGRVAGHVYMNGHLQDGRVWRHLMGYAEQNDIHSTCTTVREALLFSGRLRLPRCVTAHALQQHVDEVLDMVDLANAAERLVGAPNDGHGLSANERKRLTVAVELVANPSVLFCDEPTSGLDAHSTETVIRALRNICSKGRTVVVTVHQPTIDVFESFDSLLLIHKGGHQIYFGPLGRHSCQMVAYFEAVPGVVALPQRCNPAAWMLEVTGGAMSTLFAAANQDFAALWCSSELAAHVANDVQQSLQTAARDGRTRHSPAVQRASFAMQVHALLTKYFTIYWRSPAYNVVRMAATLWIALIGGSLYWNKGSINAAEVDASNVQDILGMLFSSTIFIGNLNMMSVQPLLSAERCVHYRERAVSMYSMAAYNIGSQSVELPYLLVQTTLFVPVSYFMVGFKRSIEGFCFYYIMFFLALSLYTFLGTLLVYITPNLPLAQLIAAGANLLMNFFNGFSIAYSAIPAGWKWMNRIVPPTWIVYGLAASQLGDNHTTIVLPNMTRSTVAAYVRGYFGYHYDFRWVCVAIVLCYVAALRVMSILALTFINYERR